MFDEHVPTTEKVLSVTSDAETIIAANAYRVGIFLQNQAERELRVRELRNETDDARVGVGTGALESRSVGGVLAATSSGALGDGGTWRRETKRQVALQYLGAAGFAGAVLVVEED